MDNTNQLAFTNAMDSSVCSSTASFGQLVVDTGNGPINRLPNEMMQLIMAKLGLDGDVKKLVRLRLVSTKWKAMVEYYCGLKKSLFVQLRPRAVVSEGLLRFFEEIFFGFVNSNNFTCLFLSTKISSECLSSMLNMFPYIEQLSIDCIYERRLNHSLQVYINSLDSLKVLDINRSPIAQLSEAVLSKLEHFSYNTCFDSEHTDDILQFIPHLGQSCVRANFGQDYRCDQFLQWHSINPNWLSNLTHLRMYICGFSADCARVVHFLSEHTILLQHLNLNTSSDVLKLTPTVLEDLGKLTHLTNVSLKFNEIFFSELEQSALKHRLISLTSVLTCKLKTPLEHTINGDRFTRVLSVVFPNLVQLDLTFVVRGYPTRVKWPALKHEIEQHLYRFPKLQKHKINVQDHYNLL